MNDIDWLVEWLIDWLIGWMIEWLIGWLVEWLIGWMIDWLVEWLIDWLNDWLIGKMIDWLDDQLIGWMIDWLVEWLIQRWYPKKGSVKMITKKFKIKPIILTNCLIEIFSFLPLLCLLVPQFLNLHKIKTRVVPDTDFAGYPANNFIGHQI